MATADEPVSLGTERAGHRRFARAGEATAKGKRRAGALALRRQLDDGITLVEVLVVMLLLAVVLLPLARVFYASLTSANSNGNRQAAAELATTVLSKLQATPYGEVGFTTTSLSATVSSYSSYGAASGSPVVYTWQGKTLVQLPTGDSNPSFTLGSNSVPFAPVMLGVLAGGGKYSVTTHIAYEAGVVSTCPGNSSSTTALVNAYLHAYVSVTWTAGTTPQGPLSVETLIYPGGLGQYSGSSYNPASTPGQPTSVSAGSTNVTGEVKVSWTVPSNWVSSQCFAVGWSNSSQQGGSTGLLPNSVLGTITPGASVSYVVPNLT